MFSPIINYVLTYHQICMISPILPTYVKILKFIYHFSYSAIPLLDLKLLIALVDMLQQVFSNDAVELLSGIVLKLFRNIGSLHGLVQKRIPVELLKETMFPDHLEASRTSLLWIFDEEGVNEVLGVVVLHELGEGDVVLLYVSVHCIGVS